MKKLLLVIFMFLCCFPLTGCEIDYPKSALYVGKNQQFSTIQSAIDASSMSGQFIVVNGGEYKEDLFISKSVTIIGKNNCVKLIGTSTIACDGVKFESIAFCGEDSVENGIVFEDLQDTNGLAFVQCSFKGFKNAGIFSNSSNDKPFNISALSITECGFVENGNSAINLNNIKALTIENCTFEMNGKTSNDLGSAIILDLIEGKFSHLIVDSSEFKDNGNNSLRGGAITCSQKNSFDGELLVDDCLFQGNSNDIVTGFEGVENSSIGICLINQRGIKTDIKKLDENN